jgi:hypothetical protein
MRLTLPHPFGRRALLPPWNDPAPVREELFGVERLEQHAQSLAAAQPVTPRPPGVLSLHTRLDDNAAVLLAAYRASSKELENGHGVVPAAEWLLDNYHLVEEHIREIRNDLPPGYYRQLPKLAEGPFAGYPRVFGLAWAFVAHTDSHFDPEILRRFIAAYQRVQPLTIGELWAVAITLRIVLIENLRRLADQITAGRAARADADALADRLLASGGARSALDSDISARSSGPVSELFAAQLAKRLRDQDPQDHAGPRLAGGTVAASGRVHRRRGAACPAAAGRLQRHRAQHHHQHASGLQHRLGGAFRKRQPRGRAAAGGKRLRRHGFPHPQSVPHRHRAVGTPFAALGIGRRRSCAGGVGRGATGTRR